MRKAVRWRRVTSAWPARITYVPLESKQNAYTSTYTHTQTYICVLGQLFSTKNRYLLLLVIWRDQTKDSAKQNYALSDNIQMHDFTHFYSYNFFTSWFSHDKQGGWVIIQNKSALSYNWKSVAAAMPALLAYKSSFLFLIIFRNNYTFIFASAAAASRNFIIINFWG